MTHDELLKKIKTQEEYWTNLVHFTNPEFYENTVDQRNAWQALKATVQLHEPEDESPKCRVCQQGGCPTVEAIDKALTWATYLES